LQRRIDKNSPYALQNSRGGFKAWIYGFKTEKLVGCTLKKEKKTKTPKQKICSKRFVFWEN
jgi:hypothetical protein